MSTRPKRQGFPVVVHVMLLRDEAVFLLRRAATGFMDGYFCLPGGHQQAGESVSEAARRECLEEAGVEVGELRPRFALPYRSGAHQGLNFVFEADAFVGEPAVAEPALFDACCWSPCRDLPERVTPWLVDALAMPEGQWFHEFHWSR